MDIWNLDSEPIVQQVLQPCEALRRRAVYLLNHVDGEIEDEDGDSANGFILADPIPSSYIHSLYSSSQGGGSRKHKLESSSSERVNTNSSSSSSHDSGGWFSCNLCQNQVCLENLAVVPALSCSCLFCKNCLSLYARSVIRDVLLPSRSTAEECVSSIRANHSAEAAAKCSRRGRGDGGSNLCCNFVDLTDDSCSEASCSSSDYIPCPSPFCDGRFPLTDLQSLAPESFIEWEAAVSEALVLNSDSFVRCPGCNVVIEKVESDLPPGLALSGVPEVDRTVPYTEFDDEGRSLSRRAMVDKAVNRFRCVLCSLDFCGACLQSPYHLGKTCEELQEERQAIRCIYCDEVCRHQINSPQAEVISSVKDIRSQLEQEGVDSSWCVEKTDLIAVQRLCDRVCGKKECRQRLKEACTRNLHCGHHCCGVRGERHCLPCLEENCQLSLTDKPLPSAADYCGICLVDPLRSAPSIQLQCGHIVHMHCARRQIQEGFPGPQISFGYLSCPQCKKLMQHSMLDVHMQKHLALMDQIKARAIKHMKVEGFYDKLQADGTSEDKLTSLALEQYQFYICSKCNSPYYGGKRNCGANLRERRPHDPSELVCGGCSAGPAGRCKLGHGKQYVEFKCRYCCSIATFFCFGNTHFCDDCHSRWGYSQMQPRECRGPQHCPLGVAHAPNGQEHCLGCSMCRSQDQL